MSIDVNSTDWLYELFGHAGPTWALILPAVGINSVSILGIFLNISVIFVSIKSRSLRGISNFLLAQISFYEVLHQLGHLLLLFLTLTGINFLPMFTAAMIMLPSVFGLNATMMALTAAALDRLFAVLFWNLRQKIHKFLYLGIHVLICIFYGIYGTRDFFIFAVANPNLPKTGYMHDMQIDPSIQDRFTRDSLIQNILAISCYLLIWIAVKIKKEANQQTNARLLKSLLVIVLMSISCYFVNMAIYQLAFTGTAYNDLRAWQMSFITGILLNVGAGSNAPILYITSSDYRKAFNEFLVPECLVGRSMSSGSGGGEGKNWILTIKNKQIQPKRGMTTIETK